MLAATGRAEGRRCTPPDGAPPGTPASSELAENPGPAERSQPAEKVHSEPAGVASRGWLAGPGFAFGLGTASVAALACAPPNVARSGLKQAALAAGRALGVDADIAVVFTTHALACSNIYYVPLANDVRGIGYQHSDAREVFDDTPGQRLEGVAFLNDWPYWQLRLGEFASAFNHEIGHRWGARVHALVVGVAPDALLGRGHDHWSYFLDSGGSPLEGNVWRATASGRASHTPLYPTRFSPLDRYLMGVLPAAGVTPFELLVDARGASEDCAGRPPEPASPPHTCGSQALQADAVSVAIEDVLAAEGPRSPPPSDAVVQVEVLVLMLHSRDEGWSAADCEMMSSAVRERIAAFEHASAGRVRLHSALGDGLGCDELSRAASVLSPSVAGSAAAASAPQDAPSCSASHRAPCGASWRVGIGLWSIAAGRRRLARRARPTRRPAGG